VGKGGVTKLSRGVLKDILVRGAEWAVENGYGRAEDLERTEERGRMAEAAVDGISERALERGTPQLGTLGAGNHFLEFQKVVEIFDEPTARAFGVQAVGQVLVMIHCGSRGLGHQVATDYIELLENAFGVAGLPDRELVNAPSSRRRSALLPVDVGRGQLRLRQPPDDRPLGPRGLRPRPRQRQRHGPDLRRLPQRGQGRGARGWRPVAAAGRPSQGRDAELRAGTARGAGAVPGRGPAGHHPRQHGHGLVPSGRDDGGRGAELRVDGPRRRPGDVAPRGLRRFRGEKIRDDLAKRGIELKSTSWKGVAEEASEAYKDVDEVVRVSDEVGLGRLVAKVVPIGVMKG